MAQFEPEIKDINFKQPLEFVLLDNYFPDVFTEFQIWNWKPFRFGLLRILERSSKSQPKYKCFFFLKKIAVKKGVKSEKNFVDNLVYKVLRLFANFPFTTTECKPDYW